MATYGQVVKWTDFDGSVHTLGVDYCNTAEEATQTAFRIAIGAGWTPPRWWQWWRWRDTPAPKIKIRRLKTYAEWKKLYYKKYGSTNKVPNHITRKTP